MSIIFSKKVLTTPWFVDIIEKHSERGAKGSTLKIEQLSDNKNPWNSGLYESADQIKKSDEKTKKHLAKQCLSKQESTHRKMLDIQT